MAVRTKTLFTNLSMSHQYIYIYICVFIISTTSIINKEIARVTKQIIFARKRET